MRILVVGDAGSIFIKEYIEYVLLPCGMDIVLIQEGNINGEYLSFYEKNAVQVEHVEIPANKLMFSIPRIRSSVAVKIWCAYIHKRYGEFDIVHIHGVNFLRGNIGLYLRRYCSKLIITIWGDELFRKSNKILKYYTRYYKVADCITVATYDMKKKFQSIYPFEFTRKVSINKFAIGLFDLIDKFKESYSREEICHEFSIDSPTKIIVLVGHNGRSAQRHIEITKNLCNLDDKIKKQIILVYTMTYGVQSQSYLDELRLLASQTGCEFLFLEEFMNEESTTKLRCISDVLIHSQLTDAFSASIQECFYSGTIIINGSWLPYNEIPNYKASVIEYDSIEEVCSILENVIENIDYYREKFSVNKKLLREISSREVTTKAWLSVIKQ